MKSEGYFSAFIHYAKQVLLAEVVVLIIASLVCWYIQWRTLDAYSNGLFLAGLIVIGFGTFGVSGSTRLTGDLRYQFAQSVMPGSLQERTRQNIHDIHDSINFSSFMALVGSLTILIAFVVKAMS